MYDGTVATRASKQIATLDLSQHVLSRSYVLDRSLCQLASVFAASGALPPRSQSGTLLPFALAGAAFASTERFFELW